MSGALELRSAINGYNKRDVEMYIQTLITENEKQVAEFKRRFDEAMKMADEKDDKCFLLESKIEELKAEVANLESKKQPEQGSENIAQMLASLEESRNQNVQLTAALKAAEAQIEVLRSAQGQEKSNGEEVEKIREQLNRSLNEATELKRLVDDQRSVITQLENDIEAAKAAGAVIHDEAGRLVTVENTYDMVTADAIEYAGQIISNAKEDAKQVIDNMKAVCCEAYDHVLKISDAIKSAQNEFSISITDVEKMLGNIEQDINMFPEEEPNPYVQVNDHQYRRPATSAGTGSGVGSGGVGVGGIGVETRYKGVGKV